MTGRGGIHILNPSEMEAHGSKTLVTGEPMRRPNWAIWLLMKAFRIVALTVLWTGLGMAAGLFCAIFVLTTTGAIHGHLPEMSLAYRRISIPVAITTGSCALLWNLGRTVQAAMARGRGR